MDYDNIDSNDPDLMADLTVYTKDVVGSLPRLPSLRLLELSNAGVASGSQVGAEGASPCSRGRGGISVEARAEGASPVLSGHSL